MLVALTIALLITAAAASALTVVLRSERSQGQRRHALFLASSWLAGRYSGSDDARSVRVRVVETGAKDQPWQWMSGQTAPATPGSPTAEVWTRAAAGEPAR